MATGQAGAILQHIQRLAETHIGPGVTDGQLLQRFTVHRDDRAFAALVRRHGRLVWGVCRHILHREHDAEDAFQATFLVLARRAASIRQGESVGSWLYGVAYRIALRAKKMAVKRQERERLAAAPEAGPAAPDPAWRELQTLLAEEVQRLPKKYRAPFVSCCLEGRSRKEAAADLGWKVGTVSSRIAQARRLLQERLARRGVLLPAALTAGVLWGQTAAAAVPAALVCATVKAAAGPAGAALISANVAGLMHEGMKAMLGAKLKLATALLLVAGLVAGGAGLAARQAPASPTADEKEETPKSAAKAARPSPNADKPAHTDRYGDPLPEGAAARLGTMRLRTADARLLAFLPDRKSLLSVASQEHGAVVSVWEVNTGKLHRRFGTTHFTNSYALSPDGKTLAAIAYDYRTGHRRLILLDVATGQELLRLGGFGAGAVSAAFAPDGKTLASLFFDGTIRLLDPATGTELRRWETKQMRNCWGFSPDGKTLALKADDGTIRLWDVAAGRETRTLGRPADSFSDAVFSPDGRTLATADYKDKVIRLWDWTTGKEIGQLRGERGSMSLAFSPDGKTLASGDCLFYEKSLTRGAVRLWDVTTRKTVRQFPGHLVGVGAVAFSADGKTLASASVGVLRLWDVDTGKELLPFPEDGIVTSVAFSPDGRSVATGGFDGTICFWDAATAKPLRRIERAHPQPLWCVMFSPDGRNLASAGEDGTVRLWNPATGSEVGRLQANREGLFHVDYSPDGRLIATAGRDKMIRLWDSATGKEIRQIACGQFANMFPGCFSPDGKTLAALDTSVGRGSSVVRLWEIATGKEVRKWETAHSGAITFSPNSKTLAGVENWPLTQATWNLHIWDVATGKGRLFALPQKTRSWAVAFSPDGRTLAWGTAEGTIYLWEVISAKMRRQLQGHQGKVWALSFAPDGRLLASAGDDTTALLWDLTGQTRAAQSAPPRPTSKKLESLWADLAGDDAGRAYEAIRTLVMSPQENVRFLQERLPPAPTLDRQRISRLIADLDSTRFAVRTKAAEELEKLGELAAPALRKALERKPSVEVQRRVQQLLAKVDGPVTQPDALRAARSVEALEYIGDAEARELLQSLSKGAPEARLTQEAKASLERLNKAPAAKP